MSQHRYIEGPWTLIGPDEYGVSCDGAEIGDDPWDEAPDCRSCDHWEDYLKTGDVHINHCLRPNNPPPYCTGPDSLCNSFVGHWFDGQTKQLPEDKP